ncbi:SpoIIE family protein phosphatase [Dethiothermospora halolimnae]|uniref:SpoIIE family protein phosphatase n=1 Tax=Dethiothermospora halolimnae TaxID=3114390 RepID=UPI003CCBAA70
MATSKNTINKSLVNETLNYESNVISIENVKSQNNILDNLQELVFILDSDKRFIGVYGKWLRKNNLSKKDFIGKKISDFFNGDGLIKHKKYIDIALKGKDVTYEWTTNINGEIFFFKTSLSIMFDKKGSLNGIIAVNRDILEDKYLKTFQMKKVQELNCIYTISNYAYKTNLDLQSILEKIPNTISFNWQSPEIAGVEMEVNNKIYLSKKFNRTKWVMEEDIVRGNEKLGYIYIYFDLKGSLHEEWSLISDDGSVAKTIADKITEVIIHKEMEEKLEKYSRRLDRILNRITDGFMLLDDQGKITLLNNESAEILKTTKEQLVGKKIWEELSFFRKDNFHNKVKDTIESKIETKYIEYMEKLKKWIEFKFFYSSDGAAVYLLDITEQKEAEIGLRNQADTLYNINKKLINDLEYVKDVQRAFNNPKTIGNGFKYTSYYSPYERVGGDFVGTVEIDDAHTIMYIGDVAGHGIQASLTSMFVHHVINTHKNTGEYEILKSPKLLLRSIYDTFNASKFSNDTYFAMFTILYNKHTRKLKYCTAGFNTEPIIMKECGKIIKLNKSEGLPIGQFDFLHLLDYKEGSYNIENNDIMLLYTDGLIELKGDYDNKDEFIENILKQNDNKEINSIKRELEKYILKFGDKIKDDITFCLSKFK